VKGDGPVFVVGRDPVGKRVGCTAFLQAVEPRNGEEESCAGPQGLTGQQAGQGRVAGIPYRGLHLDPIRVRAQRVGRRNRDLAPVAGGFHDHSLRTALDDLHLLVRVRPCGPVVGDEVGEHHAITGRFAVDDWCDVDERTARHAVRNRSVDGDGEGELLVEHRDVARRDRLTIGNWRRADDHLGGGVQRARVRRCQEQRKGPHALRHALSAPGNAARNRSTSFRRPIVVRDQLS
jgi:hypothetical protein